jgi:hypothetical protein
MSWSLQRRRVRVALNNIGVSLFERGAYWRASEVLKDVLMLMLMVDEIVPPSFLDSYQFEEHRMLRRAEQSLARHCLKERIHFAADSSATFSVSWFSETGAAPIRLENADNAPVIVILEWSIVLLNFGVAQAFLARTTSDPIVTRTLERRSLCFVALSHSLLVSDSFTAGPRNASRGVQQDQVLFVSAVVLNCYWRILLEQNRNEEAQMAFANLLQITNVLGRAELPYIKTFAGSMSPCASAA